MKAKKFQRKVRELVDSLSKVQAGSDQEVLKRIELAFKSMYAVQEPVKAAATGDGSGYSLRAPLLAEINDIRRALPVGFTLLFGEDGEDEELISTAHDDTLKAHEGVIVIKRAGREIDTIETEVRAGRFQVVYDLTAEPDADWHNVHHFALNEFIKGFITKYADPKKGRIGLRWATEQARKNWDAIPMPEINPK